MKSAGWFLAAFFLVHAFPVTAAAGDITIFAGFQDPGKLTLTSAGSSIASLTRPASFGVFGVRYGNNHVVAPEQTIAFAPNFIDSESKAFIFNSNVVIQVPVRKVRPYGTAGLGAVFVFGQGISDIGTKFAVNYGLGVKVMHRDSLGVRFDVRGYAIPGIQSQTLRATEATVGIVFSN